MKTQIFRLMICCFCLLCFITGCIREDFELPDEDKVVVGDRLPQFSVMLDDGHMFSPDSLKGRVLCLTFFNTLCGDCQAELPVLQQVSTAFSTSDVSFVCISREEDDTSVSAYWQQNGLTMPYSVQTDRTVYNLFASSRIPRIYVVDSTQTVRFVFTDEPLATHDELVDAIGSLVK